MLLHLFFRLFDLVVVRDITRGLLQARVGEVDPDARPRPLVGIFRHERYRGKFFLQVFIDDRRLVDHRIAVLQHGDFAVRIALEQLFRFVLQVALDELVRDVLFGQDNPCPVGVGSRLIGKQFHDSPPRLKFGAEPVATNIGEAIGNRQPKRRESIHFALRRRKLAAIVVSLRCLWFRNGPKE